MGGFLLDGLPGLLLEAAVDGLSDGRLHQVDVAHHQGDVEVLQVFVERPVAQVDCGGGTKHKQHQFVHVNTFLNHFQSN